MPASLFKFGAYELDRRNFELRCDGQPVKLDRTPLELLFFLVERRGTLVTHEEAVDQIWGKEVFIEAESSLYTAVRKIRKALADDIGEPQFIQTVSRKGYRFIAKVEEMDGSSASSASATSGTKRTAWIWWVVVGSVLIAGALTLWLGRRGSSTDTVMLVVLPLQNFSGDQQQDYLADGVTEEIITELGSLDPHRLGVIARTSAMQYKTGTKDIAQI